MPSTSKKKKTKQIKQKEWELGNSQQESFELLKEKLSSSPILSHPNYNKPFEIHTYASGQGLGAIFYQEQSGIKKVIVYASRGLTKGEKNYPAHKLEFLALKWCICDKFHHYLYRNHFIVSTDNNPLTTHLDATGHQWLASLGAYNFEIEYRSGKKNADADALSRIPSSSVTSICNKVDIPFVRTVTCNPDAISLAEVDYICLLKIQ